MSLRPKLLCISPSRERGGVEEYALTIAQGAVAAGWEVYAAFPQTEGTRSFALELRATGVHVHFSALREGPPRVLNDLANFVRTLRLLHKLEPDVVQLNLSWPSYCFGSLLASGLRKKSTVVVFHLVKGRLTLSRSKRRLYSWCRTPRQIWVAVSRNNRRLLCDSFHLPEEQVRVVYNGSPTTAIGMNKAAVAELRAAVRSELGLSANARIALTVGRLHAQKGHQLLALVIPELVGRFPDLRFVWVGDGPLRDELSERVEKLGVGQYVLMTGVRRDVERFYAASDLLVFPTLFEGGQSFVVSEAMATGLPIVASDASGIPEVITSGVHGLLFPASDSRALLEAVTWALEHPEEMRKMAARALVRSAEFSEEGMVERTLALFDELRTSPAPPNSPRP